MRLREIASSVYDRTIRKHLPQKVGHAGNVAVRKPRLFDINKQVRNHELPLRDAIREQIRRGDTVTLVGAGYGVSTVEAAWQAGEDGRVFAFEASPEQAKHAAETLRLNEVDSIATVSTAVVGEVRSHYGANVSDIVISPADLPRGEALVMDCEGAEIDILEEIEWRPRVVIVETHGVFDSPTDAVVAQLDEMGYEIVSTVPEKEEKDVFVLAAVRGMESD